MSYDFRDSLSALEEGKRGTVAIATVLLLLAAWAAWLVLGRVSVYVTSTSSRIEVEGATVSLEPTISGRVVSSSLRLGQKVRAGEVLVQLDAREQEYLLREQLARRGAIDEEMAALRKQIDAERAGLEGYRQLAHATRGEAAANEREASVAAEHASRQASRTEQLLKSEYISVAEYEEKASEAQRQQASSAAVRFTLERRAAEMRVGEQDRVARIAALESQLSRLAGERDALDSSLPRLRSELEKRALTAPVDGTVGHFVALHPGMYVTQGQRLASVVPERDLQIVAYLPAATALGRVQPGQEARLLLDGFPWTQFGAIEARVAQVAEEEHEGRIRVELSTSPESMRLVALKHGLTGSLEVEVERVAPLALLFRGVAGALGTAP